MKKKYPKKINKFIRELKMEAHEEELRRALVPLSEAFDRWKEGRTGSGELSELIHEFNRGPARKLFGQYNGPMQDLMVASAIARGILIKDDVSQELLKHLNDLVEFCEKEQA